MTIQELASQTAEAMQAVGYAEYTALRYYIDAYVPVIRFFEKKDKAEYDPETMAEFTQWIEERAECSGCGRAWYLKMKRGISQLVSFHDTGKIDWYWLSKVSKFKLNNYYEGILAEFLANNEFHLNTKGDIVWVARKYFAWLLMEGYGTLDGIGAKEIQRFMNYCFQHMKSSGIHNVKLYLKKLYAYLFQTDRAESSYHELLSFKVSRETKILPAVPADELAKTLSMIDRHTRKGKRDYAIILLGAVTGLRACDITNLKLTDIDWVSGEIKIVQSKTGVSLALPLTKDVGEAIKDYILKARPDTECDSLFIRRDPPHSGFVNAVAIGSMYDFYRKKAGLSREPFDGKGFHSLRRSVGKNLVTAGVSVATVAQILGHEDVESSKRYISLDSHHLKECALDFAGIEVGHHE